MPITTPIVRESQVGRLLKIFWLALGFMMGASATLKGGGGSGGRGFLNKGVRFLVKCGLQIPTQPPYGLMVAV